jgi:hypothetical protein
MCVPYSGSRTKLKQHNPKKPIRFHIRLYAVADSETAYVYHFVPYKGAGHCRLDAGETFVRKLVLEELLTNLEDKWRICFFDNYYTSIPLFEDMLRKKIYAVGVLRIVKQKALERMGSDDFPFRVPDNSSSGAARRGFLRQASRASGTGRIGASLWRDKKWVPMLYTAYVGATENISRRVGSAKVNLTTTKAHKAYSSAMGAVDRADQGISAVTVQRKTQRWYQRLFYACVDIAAWNTYVICKELYESSNGEKFKDLFATEPRIGEHVNFQLMLAKGLRAMAEDLDRDGTELAKVRPKRTIKKVFF